MYVCVCVRAVPSPSMVKVRVQHPPEASVKVHQVLKVQKQTHDSISV